MKNKPLPPTYFLICLALVFGSHFIFPITKIIHTPYNWLGWLLVVFGIILNLWTDSIFKKAKTTVKPNEKPSTLIISGPFLISRHPMYLGMTAMLFGVSVFLGSITSFIFSVVFVILMQKFFISFEEKQMEKYFGNKYLEYKMRVRCWL